VTLSILLVIVASMLATYVAATALVYVTLPLARCASWLVEALAAPFSSMAVRIDIGARRKSIRAEVDRELGRADPLGQQARADVVRAAAEAQRIRVLDQMFRSAVQKCVSTHWAVAEGLGATHMAEAARHPMSQSLRLRVVDISEELGDAIATYPLLLDAPDLVRLQVALQRIAPTCIACPYWTATMSDAPRLCPPAAALKCDRDKHVVVDAQIVSE
jgi:hypothetical protein